MIAMLLAALASQAAAGENAETARFRGHCQYSEAARQYRHETVLALCDALTIERLNTGATIDFRQRSWGSMMRFAGEMSGDRMTVRRLTLRTGKSLEATGTCEIFHANGRISVVACLARVGARTYAGNFMVSRL